MSYSRSCGLWLRLGILTVLATHTATALAAPEVREVHKDWTVICEAGQDTGSNCIIVQQKNLKNTDQLALRIEVGHSPQNGQAIMIVTTPLGVSLPPGLSMQVDDHELLKFQYGSCMSAGCVVGTNLTDEMIETFRGGQQANFTFLGGNGQEITVPISLAGYTAAYRVVSQ
ncbi:MAG: hypothetical protein CMO26_14650 [Thiotrichales bacterium]|nr:hypothetical protein [Thiotrichales bacterium]|tara:strand:- start:1030 stop:1542 length:513 start_codon:yes stop_codon:yes gene_type:complete